MRDIAPDQDDTWFERYGRVARTGESARFEEHSTPLARWWNVYAFRVGDPALRRVGVLFHDMAERDRLCARRRPARDAAEASEARYRTLFESIDEGFCVVEVLFDAGERPVDYRFLEANPAFVQQTGLTDAVGRTVRELAPTHEAHWFEIYGRVAPTGEPTRFEAAPRRWAAGSTCTPSASARRRSGGSRSSSTTSPPRRPPGRARAPAGRAERRAGATAL